MLEKQIKSFQKIFEEETEERIGEADAICQGTHLLNLVKTTLEVNVNFNKD
jgi:hypothetical protein